MTIEVRRATLADVACVCDFNRLLAWETEAKVLAAELLVPGVSAVLTDASKGLYFLAVAGEEVLGQMGVTYEWSDWRNGWFWWVQSVYVRQDARRRGACRQLYETITQNAAAAGVVGVRLYVERDNIKAQETYRKMGLAHTSYHVMEQYPL